MIRKASVISFICAMFLSLNVAYSATSNFEPANRSGDVPAPEVSEKFREPKSREPGFWQKEFERSGLKNAAKSILSIGGALEKKDSSDES